MSSSSWHRLLYPGLLLFGLSLPLSKSASTILLGALYLSAIAAALCNKEFRGDVRRSCRQPLTASLLLYCLVAYVGIIHTEHYAEGFSIANKFVSLPAIYFFVSLLLQSESSEEARTRKAEYLLLSYLTGLAVLNLVGMLSFLGVIGDQAFTLPFAPLGLHHIWFSNINALGLYTAAALLLFSRYGTSTRGKVYLLGFIVLCSLGILLSISRTAWFSILLTASILAFILIRSRKTIFLVAVLSVLMLAAVYQFVPIVHDRIDLIAQDIELYSISKKKASSIGSRIWMWKASLMMFQSHPVIGVGTGDYIHGMEEFRRLRLLPRYLLDYNQPHNMYLFTMATNGIVGLVALLQIFYRILRSVVPTVRTGGGTLFAFLALATAVHFIVAGFMDSFFNIQILCYSFAFIMGVCIRGSVGCTRRP